MRHIWTGLLAAALALCLVAAQPAQAKVYKMDPAERAAALKEKKTKRAKAKKSGKAAPGQDQGGWVEVKPGEKVAKRNRKAKAEEAAQATEKKGRKSKKAKAAEEQPAERKTDKKSARKAEAAVEHKADKKTEKKADKQADRKVEKKSGKKSEKQAEAKAEKRSGKKGRRSASRGDRVVGSGYSGEQKVSGSNAEVRRPADDLSAYSVSRPGQQGKAPAGAAAPAAQAPVPTAVPEVRQEVQPGPLDTSTPVGTEQKTGEGRF
jgi:hypothetical protein